ncbi:MAG: TolC family protein [Bacteroidota bacterium]
MKQVLRHIILVITSVMSLKGAAQDMSLNDYLEYLAKESLPLKQSTNQILTTRLDARSVRSRLLPTLATDFNYQRDFSKNFLFFNDDSFGETKIRTNFNNAIDANVIVEQAIYEPVASNQFKAAKLATEESELRHKETVNELAFQGTQLFLQALFEREVIKILEENYALAGQQKNQTRDLFNKGLTSELELRKAELFHKQSLPQLVSAKNRYQTLINDLQVLAGLPDGFKLNPVGQINPERNLSEIDSSLTRNYRIQSLHRQLGISDFDIMARKAAWNPVIKLQLGYNLNAQDNAFAFDNDNRLWYGRVSVEIPIFTGGHNKAQLQKSRIVRESLSYELDHTRRTLSAQLENAYGNLNLAWQQVEIFAEALLISERESEISDLQATQGLITAVERKQTRLNLTRARLELLEANLQASLAQIEIDKIVGTSLIKNSKK